MHLKLHTDHTRNFPTVDATLPMAARSQWRRLPCWPMSAVTTLSPPVQAWLRSLDDGVLRDEFDPGTFQRAVGYAQGNRVVLTGTAGNPSVLEARVIGSRSRLYTRPSSRTSTAAQASWTTGPPGVQLPDGRRLQACGGSDHGRPPSAGWWGGACDVADCRPAIRRHRVGATAEAVGHRVARGRAATARPADRASTTWRRAGPLPRPGCCCGR